MEVTKEKPKNTLSTIVSESAEIVQQIIMNGGELTPALEEEMAINDIQLTGKLDAYGYLWERLDNEEEYWKAKAAEFARVARSVKRVRDSLKDRMKFAMVSTEKQEMTGDDFRFKLAKTSGKLIINSEENIPDEFTTEIITTEINKPGLKAALASGDLEIDGVWIEKEPSLRKYANRKQVKGK